MLDPVLCTTTINAVDKLLRGTTYLELNNDACALLRLLKSHPGSMELLADFWFSDDSKKARPIDTRSFVTLIRDAVYETGGLMDTLPLREFPRPKRSLLERIYSLLHFSRARFAEYARGPEYDKTRELALRAELKSLRKILTRSIVGKRFLTHVRSIKIHFEFCSRLVYLGHCIEGCTRDSSWILHEYSERRVAYMLSIFARTREFLSYLNNHQFVSESQEAIILRVFEVLAGAVNKLPKPDHQRDAWLQVLTIVFRIRDCDVLTRVFDLIFVVAPLCLWDAYQQGLFAWRLSVPTTIAGQNMQEETMGKDARPAALIHERLPDVAIVWYSKGEECTGSRLMYMHIRSRCLKYAVDLR